MTKRRACTFVANMLTAAVVGLAVAAEPAMALDAAKAGQTLGKVIRDLMIPIVGVIGGMMCVGALVAQQFSRMLATAGMVILTMLFLVDDSPVVKLGETVARQLGN